MFGTDGDFWRIYFREVGEKSIGKDYDQLTVIEPAEDLSQPGISDIMTAMEHVLDDFTDKLRGDERVESVELGDRWDGGTLVLQPAMRCLSPKTCPSTPSFIRLS